MQQNQFTSGYLITAASPQTGEHFSLVTSCIDTVVMNLFLNQFSISLPNNTHAILILDGAGWHRSKNLEIPSNITLHQIPAYSPQLNPIENLWAYVKSNFLSGRIYADMADIITKGCNALNCLTSDIIKSVCHRDWVSNLDMN